MANFVSAAARFPFRVGYPWALIERNSGHQLVYLTDCKVNADGESEYRGYIWSETSQSYSRTERPIRYERIRRTWRNAPSLQAIRRAKAAANKKLRRAEAAGHFGRALRSAA